MAAGLPADRQESLVPVAFVFVDTTTAKVANTVAVLEEAGRRCWAPRRYESIHWGITAEGLRQRCPSLSPLWSGSRSTTRTRRLGRVGEQTLTAALDNSDGDILFRDQEARADAEEERCPCR